MAKDAVQTSHVVDLELEPHEASGLVTSRSARLQEALGWSPLYWTVLDDGPVRECIAVIGREAGAVEPTAGWGSRLLRCDVTTPTGETDDGEAIAEHDGWIYVFGSAYGSKEGPLEPERSFIARFHEDDVEVGDDGAVRVDLHVRRDPFVLHHLVNDALRRRRVDVLPPSPRYRKKTVAKARKKAVKRGKPWAWRLRHDDVPINVEGAAFLANGDVLVGLRIPVTGDGHPIAVQLAGVDRLFDPEAGDPVVRAVWLFEDIGSRRELVGIRDLHVADDALHLLVGNLDSSSPKSVLLAEHPEGGAAVSEHWRTELPEVPDTDGVAVVRLRAERVRAFDGQRRVEGLAEVDGSFLYVSDEDDRVRTRFFAPSSTGDDAS